MRISMILLVTACVAGLELNAFAAKSSIRFHAGPEAAKRDAREKKLPIVVYFYRSGSKTTKIYEELMEVVTSKEFHSGFRDSSEKRREVRTRLVSKAIFFGQLIPASSDSFGGKLLEKYDLETIPGALVFDLNGDELTLRGSVSTKGKDVKGKTFDEFVQALEEVLDKKPDSDQAKQ